MIAAESFGEIRTARITGAAGSVGQATFALLHASGHRCYLVDRDEVSLRVLSEGRDRVAVEFADVTDAQTLKEVVERATASLPTLRARGRGSSRYRVPLFGREQLLYRRRLHGRRRLYLPLR